MKSMVDAIRTFAQPKQEHYLRLLGESVALKGVRADPLPGKPFGEDVHNALEHMLDIARKMGFEAQNHEGYVGTVDWGIGDEMVGVLSHIDVVPAGDMSAWQTPPFVMTEKDGYIYGRGVADDKGPLLSSLYGMYALKCLGYVPSKRIRIIIGANEETGWGCIKYYKENKLDVPNVSFSPDGRFTAVNREKGLVASVYEKHLGSSGVGSIQIDGGVATNSVPSDAEAVFETYTDELLACANTAIKAQPELAEREYRAEKVNDSLVVRCHGKSAHAMAPTAGINAITQLFKLLKDMECLSDEYRSSLVNVLKLFDDNCDGQAMGVACSDDVSGALTINLGKMTLKNGVLHLEVDERAPVTADVYKLSGAIDKCFADIGFEPITHTIKPPLYLNADLPLIKTLSSIYEAVSEERAEIHSLPAGTYARAFPNCVCFGATYPHEPGLNIHMPNERALISNVIRNITMYGVAIGVLSESHKN